MLLLLPCVALGAGGGEFGKREISSPFVPPNLTLDVFLPPHLGLHQAIAKSKKAKETKAMIDLHQVPSGREYVCVCM